MEPKTTQNLFNDYFTNSIHKLILLCSAFFYKKVLLAPFNIVFVFMLIFFPANSYSQSCKATLQVEKNRSTKSVPPEGMAYKLLISNTGSSNSTYVLSVSNINSSCSNNDGSNNSSNVNLNFTFADTNTNSINQVSVSPGETIPFIVQVKVPNGTAINRWNCTQITATSIECPSYKVNTVLHTLVSDPNVE
jgi:hypothetical protein